MVKLYCKTWPGEGPPLIVLHGLLGNQGNWAWHCKQLQDAFTVHALDLRNHGRSPWHDVHDYPSMADDILATMDELNIEQADVLGHSMGGKVAMHLALHSPARISRLVVVDIAPVAYQKDESMPMKTMLALHPAELASRSDADAALAKDIDNKPLRDFLLTNLERDKEGGYRWRCNLKVLARSWEQLIGFPGQSGCFDHPVLFIKGGQSSYLLPEHTATVMSQFPQAQVKTIAAAGHWVHSEKPQVFMSILQRFLEQGN